MIKHLLTLFGLASLSSCSPYTPSHNLEDVARPNTPFRLVIDSEYGSKKILDLANPTEEDIIQWMDKLDWNYFHSVAIHHDDSNWFDVGGSLNPKEGLSSMVRIGGDDWVIPIAPTTVKQMKDLILSYYRNDDKWKKEFK